MADSAAAAAVTSPDLEPAENLQRLLAASSIGEPGSGGNGDAASRANGADSSGTSGSSGSWRPVLDASRVFSLIANTDSVLRDPEAFHKLAGAGFLPWEIHRPQRAVRELARMGALRGRVLEVGCGIGDNALFIAKYCKPDCVVACDKVQRCLAFGEVKAGIRGMLDAVKWVEADVLDPGAPALLGAPFDTVLDSGMLVCFPLEQRPAYLANLQRLVAPGGRLHIICLSERETRPGLLRLSRDELAALFEPSAFEVVSVEDTVYEQHPAAPQYASYLATFLRGTGTAPALPAAAV